MQNCRNSGVVPCAGNLKFGMSLPLASFSITKKYQKFRRHSHAFKPLSKWVKIMIFTQNDLKSVLLTLKTTHSTCAELIPPCAFFLSRKILKISKIENALFWPRNHWKHFGNLPVPQTPYFRKKHFRIFSHPYGLLAGLVALSLEHLLSSQNK